jgi:hypothetical protein
MNQRSGTNAPAIDRASNSNQTNNQTTSNASRWDVTTQLVSEYEKLIMAAIRRSKYESVIDCGVDEEDLLQDVTHLLYRYALELIRPGTAKTSTRIYRLIKTHMRNVNTKLYRQVQITRHRFDDIPVERITREEMAAERAAEHDSYLPC